MSAIAADVTREPMPERLIALQNWLATQLSAPVTDIALAPLRGGAIQENWLITCKVRGISQSFVLRKDAAATISASHTRKSEFALLTLAYQSGVIVPEPIAFCEDATIFGAPFAFMRKVEGIGLGPRIVKDMAFGGDREALAMRLGEEMARIHAISPPRNELPFLDAPPSDFAAKDIAELRAWLDALPAFHPLLEWLLSRAEAMRPKTDEITLCHRDFRTGNYMVDAHGLTAILDWEFAGWGDPHVDIGWFCAECWRFSRPDLEAGGIGTRAAFYRGYASVSSRVIEPEKVHFYEIMAHLRWAIIALQQGERHDSGKEFSLELALTGRMAAELNWHALQMLLPHLTFPKAALQPDAPLTKLIADAERTTREGLARHLQGDDRFAALVIAGALRMGVREAGLDAQRAAALRALYDVAGIKWDEPAALKAKLRAGENNDAQLIQALIHLAHVEVSISKPQVFG